ncbi:hypothetical protein BJ742DRAFT_885963 [Cladochytrium replicatum]|nr:hypothetical protein BJ742DRAFT_885963 [Cladochytrium replicatum]
MPGALKLLRLSVLIHHHQHNINLRLKQQKSGNGWEHQQVSSQLEGNSSSSSFTIHIPGITHNHEDDPAMMLRDHLSLTKVNVEASPKNQALLVPSYDFAQSSDLSLFPPLPGGEPQTQDYWDETHAPSHQTRVSMVAVSGMKPTDPPSIRVPLLDLKKVHPVTHSNTLPAIGGYRISAASNVPEKHAADDDNVAIPPEWNIGPAEPPESDPGVISTSIGVHWKEHPEAERSNCMKSRSLLQHFFDGYLMWMYRIVISDRTLHWILVGSLVIVVVGVTITTVVDPGLRDCRAISSSQHLCVGPAINIWSILDLLMLIPTIPCAIHFLRKRDDHYRLKLETIVILVYNCYMAVWWVVRSVLELPEGSTGLGSSLYISTLIVFIWMVSLFGYYPLFRAHRQLRAAGRLKITPLNGSEHSFDNQETTQRTHKTTDGNTKDGGLHRLMIKRTTVESDENMRQEFLKPTMSLADFYRVMNDRQLRASLHKFAASDFSTELLLFFQAYRALVRAARKHFPNAPAPKQNLEENLKDQTGKGRKDSADPKKQSQLDHGHETGSPRSMSHDRSHIDHSRQGTDSLPSEHGKISKSIWPVSFRSHSFTNEPETPWWTDFNPASRASKLPHFPVPDTLKDLYLGVYEQFFVRGADQELNVPGRMLNEVRNQFQAGDIWLDIYDTAKNEVMMMLYLNTYSKWVKSLQ